ncbi:MAG: 4Fe-4S binding protein [Chitinophagales bacterium]
MSEVNTSMSLAEHNGSLNTNQKIGVASVVIGLFLCLLAYMNFHITMGPAFMYAAIVLIIAGTVIYARATYLHLPEGIKNNNIFLRSFTNRGLWGWAAAVVLTAFYILLYWFPAYLGLGMNGEANWGIIGFFDPLSMLLKGQPASQWFMYGVFYTICILAMGYKFILKYRHNKYQVVRTISVMFFQLAFAFLIPEFMLGMNLPFNDFKNMWPLNYYFFDGWHLQELLHEPLGIGLLMLVFGIAMIFIISPILTYFYGKRWYCSWVCGCGGLAETAGDPFRHNSDKSLKAWRLERVLIHAVLVFACIMTIAVLYSFLVANPQGYAFTKEMLTGTVVIVFGGLLLLMFIKPSQFKSISRQNKSIIISILVVLILFTLFAYFKNVQQVFFVDSQKLRQWYGFYIGAAFSGVIGVGFYPIFGSRVWCRFGCPMAAILGLQQRFFSRFRITTNGSQCISCGNCSTYCEMGIDVRWYAQRGQNIVRASCVGCGICSAVCPRGVLKLENGPVNAKRTEIQMTTHDLVVYEDVNILPR